MALYAVFGQPILHSKSPQMFRPLLDASDQYIRIRPASPENIIQIVKALNISGASITAPLKEKLLPLLDEVSEEAKSIGAVNCIRREENRIIGHNTDQKGVTGALEEAGLKLKGANILVLGAGGAAKAAAYGLSKAQANLFISNRTTDSGKKLATMYNAELIPWKQGGKTPWFDAVVSTILPEAIPPYAGYMAYGCLLDAVYKPSLMSEHTRSRGIKIIPGERWLIHQGLEAASFYISGKNDLSQKSTTTVKLEKGLKTKASAENLRIFVFNKTSMKDFGSGDYDLIISGLGLNKKSIAAIIDEEKHLAFGC